MGRGVVRRENEQNGCMEIQNGYEGIKWH